MSKLIFLLLAVAVAWMVLKGHRKSKRERPPPAPAAEDMVQCAHCGVHLPRSESRAANEKYFCSDEHLRLHR